MASEVKVLTREQARLLADMLRPFIDPAIVAMGNALRDYAAGKWRPAVPCDHSLGRYNRAYRQCDCCNDTGWRVTETKDKSDE